MSVASQNRPFAIAEPTAGRRTVLFKLVDRTDNLTPETGVALTGAEIQVSKNGGAFANAAGTVTEIAGGVYSYEFTVGELDTLGNIRLKVDDAAAAIVVQEYEVDMPLHVYSEEYSEGAVYIASWGVATSVVGVDGTRDNPVSTIAAAYTLTQALDIRKIVWLDDHNQSLTAQNWDGYQFIAEGNSFTTLTVTAGTSFDGCYFRDIVVTGVFPASADLVEIYGGAVNGVTLPLVCSLVEVGLGGTTKLSAGGLASFVDCYEAEAVAGVPPVFDFNGATPLGPIEFTGWRGRLSVVNMTVASSKLRMRVLAGEITISSSCTAGAIKLEGDFALLWDAALGVSGDLSSWNRVLEGYDRQGVPAVWADDGGVAVTQANFVFGVHGKANTPVTTMEVVGDIFSALSDLGVVCATVAVLNQLTLANSSSIPNCVIVGSVDTGGVGVAPVVDISGTDFLAIVRHALVISDPATPTGASGAYTFEDCFLDGSSIAGGNVYEGFGLPVSMRAERCAFGGDYYWTAAPGKGGFISFTALDCSAYLPALFDWLPSTGGSAPGHRRVRFHAVAGSPILDMKRLHNFSMSVDGLPILADFDFIGGLLELDPTLAESIIRVRGDVDVIDGDLGINCALDLNGVVPRGAHDVIREARLTYFGSAWVDMYQAAIDAAVSFPESMRFLFLEAAPGTDGNAITVAVTQDLGLPGGTAAITEAGNAVTIRHNGADVATMAAAVTAQATLVRVRFFQDRHAGFGLGVDPIPATPLAGGIDNAMDASTLYITDSASSGSYDGMRVIVHNSRDNTEEEAIIKTSEQEIGTSVLPNNPVAEPIGDRGRMKLVLETPLSAAPRFGDTVVIRPSPKEFPWENTLLDNQVYIEDGGVRTLVSARLRVFPNSTLAANATKGAAGLEGAILSYTITGSQSTPGRVDQHRTVTD